MIKYSLLIFWLIPICTWGQTKCSQIEYGDKNAPLKIIEYASPSCTVCSEFSRTIFPHLNKYIKAKKAHLTVINLPYNAIDLKACVLIKHSPNPSEFNMIVYERQKDWLFSKAPIKSLTQLLEKQGMPAKEIRKALRNKNSEDKIIHQRLEEEGQQTIDAIPLLVIGKKRIIGLMPWNKLHLVIESALQHINKGQPLDTFGKNDEKNKKSKRKTTPFKKRNPS